MRSERVISLGLVLVALALPLARGDEDVRIKADVIYGRKDGMTLTFDMFSPAKPNGAGVIFPQSGGWYSVWTDPQVSFVSCRPLLDKGFTVFVVRHGSAPKYNIPEIMEDVRRSVRFIRFRAKDFGVDSDRLGALGGSAGGHLALMLATTGDDGDVSNQDEVQRQSSRVAVVVAMYPPSDIRDWVAHPLEAIKPFPNLKFPLTFDPATAPDYSPALCVTAATPPTLLIHGDRDEFVPIEHSRKMLAALQEKKIESKLIVIEGATHVFTADDYGIAVPAMVEWFEKHLTRKSEGSSRQSENGKVMMNRLDRIERSVRCRT